ncbi:clumping factor B-like [Anoplopoma fimbria]|uniref:clumping factor B-like n=1 Tax=Anoplopoma fimbria TaxID=229290 RepID=UPI0023EBAE64|nr:clumping factor B-like [Anoplopoma fimbria]
MVSPLRSEFPYQNKHAINDKGDADADQQREPTEVPQSDPSDSEEKNDPDPPSVRDDLSEDTESSPQVPISSEQPGSENNTDEHKETASPLRTEFQDLNKHAINDKGGADADQHSEPAGEEVPQSNPSDTEKENGPDHADVLDDSSEDAQSGPQVTFSSEKPGYVSSIRKKFEPNHHRRTSQREPEKEENESKEAQSAPAGAETSPADQPHTTESSPNMAPKDTPGEHEGVANSDQVTGESAEKNVSKSDSSGQGERNESDDSSEDKPSVPDQRGSNPILQDLELDFSQEDRNTSKDNQQEDESKTDSVGKHEETDSDQDMYSDTSKQPPSPTQTKPDNRNTDTCQETPDTEHAHPDEEEEKHKTSTDSNETEG